MQKHINSTNYILDETSKMMLYLIREVSEVGFNMIIKSSTAMPCVVLDQNTIYQQNSVLIIIIFITLTPIEPEVHFNGFLHWAL